MKKPVHETSANSPENFRQCILKEVIPFIEKNFPATRTDEYYSALPEEDILHFILSSTMPRIRTIFFAPISEQVRISRKRKPANFMNSKNFYRRRIILFIQNCILTYGSLEGYDFMIGPDDKMFRLLDKRGYRGLEFIHHVYPQKNHYTNMRPTMVDGVRLFLADNINRGIGFMDFPQNSAFYHFNNSAEVYDWDYSLYNKQPAIRNVCLDPAHSSEQDGSGSLKAVCHFAGADSNEANIGTVFDHLEDFSGKTLSVKVFVPQDLAAMDCSLKTYITSTDNWTDDEQKTILLKNGWNDIRWNLSGVQAKGNFKEVRRFGWIILHPEYNPAWDGNILFDEIRW